MNRNECLTIMNKIILAILLVGFQGANAGKNLRGVSASDFGGVGGGGTMIQSTPYAGVSGSGSGGRPGKPGRGIDQMNRGILKIINKTINTKGTLV